MKVVFFPTPGGFQSWLEESHQRCDELWVGFYKKSSGKPSISYPEAVDEALCFGWIDGVRRKVTDNAYTVRFTPRTPKSQWSTVNIKKAQKLSAAGRLRPAGLEAFARANHQPRKYSYEQRNQASFSAEQEHRFRSKTSRPGTSSRPSLRGTSERQPSGSSARNRKKPGKEG